jgi:hypothetical protein
MKKIPCHAAVFIGLRDALVFLQESIVLDNSNQLIVVIVCSKLPSASCWLWRLGSFVLWSRRRCALDGEEIEIPCKVLYHTYERHGVCAVKR